MFPKHIACVPNSRQALAPYNFVELPDQVVQAQPIPDGDRYHPDRYTGKIECILTTESPMYTRCGWSPEDFAQYGDKAFHELPNAIQQKRANFFINPVTQQPMIPGSSLRGMLRTLVEIVSFSKIDRVSNHQRLFFRSVGSNPTKESWGKEYKQYVKPEIVKAGYLKKVENSWKIQPATGYEEVGVSFAWVNESELTTITDFKKFDDPNYEPQYIPISYERAHIDQNDRAKRLFAHDIALPDDYPRKGTLVTSGHMKQKDEPSPRRNHCIVFPIDNSAEPLELDNQAIEHYRNALTDFQKASPFDKDWGILEDGRPVFYYHDGKSKTVGFFGQSPNFRIPYSPEGDGHATTVKDFIPPVLRESASFDLADVIFGWVKQESQEKKSSPDFDEKQKQHVGRVSVTDALYQIDENSIWDSESPLTPQILSEPKPTLFSHYLVQPAEDNPDASPLKIKHYASKPIEQTVIRGHKMYWHKGDKPNFRLPPPKKVINAEKKVESDIDSKQTTLIKPIKKGISFNFSIHFENLSDVELGALLWVLDLAQDEQYRLSLGMGKPLGMGAVKITHKLYLKQRKQRYAKLFADEQWFTGYSAEPDSQPYIDAFDAYIRQAIGAAESSLKDVRRIKMLLAMLSWTEAPSPEQTRYLEIECDPTKTKCIAKPKSGKKTANEYADRPVLPTPLQVIGWKSCGNENDNPNSGNSGKGNSPKPNSPKPGGRGDRSAAKPQKSSSAGTGKTSMAAAFERATQRPKRP